ncbi:pentapeptide repeat-containing protein [Synechococcus elongatus]|uniref:Pentapeptide repeat-containing protein n=1 Tax=Synechococcus elongatus PCC 11801 TaxID=2219813 RepID=A0AAN1QM17_SYNEL|nr:pentapeptide repeat-containing protein [Synechococcus elongatus]AZB71819.1 pentapeptide repeat-containing protein [Synechococcus elongatus PCC 11801]
MTLLPEDAPRSRLKLYWPFARLPELLPIWPLLLGSGAILLSLLTGWRWLLAIASITTAAIAGLHLLPPLIQRWKHRFDRPETRQTIALIGLLLAVIGLSVVLGLWQPLISVYTSGNWDAIGAIGEGIIGAFGQILLALVALIIAWRQYSIDKRLTTQQNQITQAQTIDSFIQGISDLISDEEGLLEDWPLERMLAEGRTAAVLSSVDGQGKAKILRFLSHARLLTPLKRDHRLGRAILDGSGGYAEDRIEGIPVIQLLAMLAGSNLQATDLRSIDFNRADLQSADLQEADLSQANLAGCNLTGSRLSEANLAQTRWFYGHWETATPAQPNLTPDYETGIGTGAIVEDVDFSEVQALSPEARYYCCSWCGSRSRSTIPGGCKGIPNRLDR